MNLKKYESADQATRIRMEACKLAVQAMGPGDLEREGAGRLMALCVFFESYIAHGANWTDKHMKLMHAYPVATHDR